MKAQRWIVLPDHQVPYEDKETLRAVEAYIADNRWDGLVNLGDFLDFQELARFNEGRPGAIKGVVGNSFASGRNVLDRQLRALRSRNKLARYVLLEGNHDYRATTWAEKHPEMADLLDVPTGLGLRERRVEWVPSWSKGKLFRLGNAFFTHGLITSKHHASVMAARYGVPIFYGHTHDVSEFSAVLHGDDKTIVGKSLGCLCRYDQAYMKGAPHNWQQAISTFFVNPDGYFNEYTTRIFKHRFVAPDGKIYDGRNRRGR